MGFQFSTRIFHFRRNPPFQNLLLKTPFILFSSFSTLSAERKTFPHIFQECSKKKAHEPDRQSHARMIVSAFNPTVIDATCLLQMYIKCSRLECAVKVFDRMSERNCVSWNAMIYGYSINGEMGLAQSLFGLMPERDVVSWTSLISGYLQNGNCLKSVEVFVMMGRDDVAYNETTFSIVLKACAILENKVIGVQVHGAVVKCGFEFEVVIGTAMLDMYAKCNMLDDLKRFFDAMPERNVISWTSLMSGYFHNGNCLKLVEVFVMMGRDDVAYNEITFSVVLKACGILKDYVLGQLVHGAVVKCGFECNVVTATAMVDAYAKCDNLIDARKVFNLLQNHDLQSYTALIVGYSRGDRGFEGMQLFLQLLKSNLGFDEIILSAAFSACAVNKGLVVGTQIHGLAIKTPFHENIRVASAIINMYGKCGALPEAHRIFDEVEKRNVVTWNTMVCAYADHGYGNEALQVFEKMVIEKVMPNHATFVGVLHVCAHSGLVDEALHYLYVMHSDYGVLPDLQHYSCVVDALGRCGQIIDALKLIENMPLKANHVVWTSLLSNCKLHGNVKVAEIAAKSLLQLDPQDSTAYVLLLQIYADAGMWDKASKMRRIIRSNGLINKPGCSRIFFYFFFEQYYKKFLKKRDGELEPNMIILDRKICQLLDCL